jgi:pyridoxal biosynthesis lyase PdxS
MINTSFNLSWEPIVCSPQDAYETFMASGIDTLCIGHFVLTKSAQPSKVTADVTEAVKVYDEKKVNLQPSGRIVNHHLSNCGYSA